MILHQILFLTYNENRKFLLIEYLLLHTLKYFRSKIPNDGITKLRTLGTVVLHSESTFWKVKTQKSTFWKIKIYGATNIELRVTVRAMLL